MAKFIYNLVVRTRTAAGKETRQDKPIDLGESNAMNDVIRAWCVVVCSAQIIDELKSEGLSASDIDFSDDCLRSIITMHNGTTITITPKAN